MDNSYVGGLQHRFKSKLQASHLCNTTITKRGIFRLFLLLFLLAPPAFTWWVVFRRRPQTILEIVRRLLRSSPRVAMDWLGRASITYTHSDAPLPLRKKDGSQTDLLKVVEQSVPSCQLNPLLFNGHLQTFWSATKVPGPTIYYKRRIFDADHKTYPGTFAVDFVRDKFEETDKTLPPRTVYFTDDEWEAMRSDDNRPMLVALHGLSGGSYELYLREAIWPLVQSQKWDVCVINARGCARTVITSGVLFNARATWDVRQLINWISERYPNRPLFAIGFSLGANILTNVRILVEMYL